MKIGKKIGEKVEKGVERGKKYAWRITLVAVVILSLVLIGRPLMTIIKTSIEISQLNKEKARYEASIRKDSILIESLKNDDFLERYARENYFMRGQDEQVFIVED